jgi:hypothetical protein
MSVLGSLGSALLSVGEAPTIGTNPAGSLVSGATDSLASDGLNKIGSWVLGGTESALKTVAQIIGTATAPNLESAWFGAAYWRVAALAALLTVPFLFAAAVQALVRSDLALLTRSAFIYMPLSLIAVGLAAPVTMLLLAATDQMSAAVSAVGVEGGAKFLDSAAAAAAKYSAVDGSAFFAVVIALFAMLAALALALEMLVREAAVYVVVLMLPLGFAAMVWPARRVWATRLIELLVSLILSKFVIVAVLSLAGAALASGSSAISRLLVAMALVMLSVFAPWTLMRVLPFTEVAAGAAGALRRDLPISVERYGQAASAGLGLVDPGLGLTARLAGAGPGHSDAEGEPLTGFAQSRTPTGTAGGSDREPAETPGGSVGDPAAAGTTAAHSAGGSGAAAAGAAAAGVGVGAGLAGGAGSVGVGPAGGAGSVGVGPAGGAGSVGAEPGAVAPVSAVDPRPPMDPHWDPNSDWEEVSLDSGLVTDGITYTPSGSDQRTSSFDAPPVEAADPVGSGPEGLQGEPAPTDDRWPPAHRDPYGGWENL